MGTMDSRASSVGGGTGLLVWGAILFGLGALTAILFLERVMQWPLGWPFYPGTGILIGAVVAFLGHALLIAGLVQRRS
jgi:hypothetical protein